ncbi:acylase [Iamia sp. SCSIO 61187]|uniref:penicillin acylase family protein n=1 Tax=Iamia sp. SCSIO 61187 TaxID=2722752 RepID=UPI001C6264C7|nr:penicillin acylase family protein [Iamia sp. SCSIO 61187]QYG94007.1 acylase [Iamia sp. SCSIO 61187]
MRTHLARRGLAVALATLVLAVGCSGDDGGDDEARPGDDAGTDVEVRGDEGAYEATIRRDAAGVPHITGETVRDLTFGQGWASGEDRTCDLADQIIKVTGQRARWFGRGEEDANLESDVAWRAIGIAEVAAADWEEASDEVRDLLTAYADGWNAHLADVGADGIGDWCEGEEWVRPVEPVEVYTYARAIALQASSGAVADLLATAQPPAAGDTAPTTEPTAATVGATLPGAIAPVAASNGWAVGAARSTEGGGMLVGNPHFPWEGELRFWEVHLTVPGEVDVYGVQLSGVPGIGIGFTETFGWTHTVSAGNRFTAYRLDLVPGDPTRYVYGDEERAIEPTEVSIGVMGDDGEVTEETRTIWRSHYGPMLDFPGFGWTDTAAITFRDANIDNDEFVEQYLQMLQADDLDDFIAVHRDTTGVPLFNTVATSADGRAWYADTSATPALSDEALAAYELSLESDPIVGVAADSGAVLLDGSDPLFEWEEREGARDPGLVPYDEMPVTERDDYVFNANDSFWISHATELLAGDYSPLHGRQGVAPSVRTRENAVVLDDTTPEGPAGDDGTFTLDELADAALQNRGFTSRSLLDAVVERCTGAAPVTVAALTDDEDGEVLPAATVDLAEACAVLDGWDGVYDLDRAGAIVWRELMDGFSRDELSDAGPVWAEPFDPADPVATPSGLAPAPAGEDPILVALARAVQILDAAGIAVDTPLGEVQQADRNGTLVPIHGGNGVDGTTNVVGYGGRASILDPTLDEIEVDWLADFSDLGRYVGATGAELDGYPINNGTSFLYALAFGEDGPEAKAFLTYGDTADRSDPLYTEATEAFSDKAWRDVAFTEDDVAAAAETEVRVQG